MFAARVAGSSRPGPLVLGEAGAARTAPEKAKRVLGKDKKQNNQAVGVAARCSEEEGNTKRKLSQFILQVARALATEVGRKRNRGAKCRLQAASLPVCLVCCRWTNGRLRLKLPHCNTRRSSSEVEEDR